MRKSCPPTVLTIAVVLLTLGAPFFLGTGLIGVLPAAAPGLQESDPILAESLAADSSVRFGVEFLLSVLAILLGLLLLITGLALLRLHRQGLFLLGLSAAFALALFLADTVLAVLDLGAPPPATEEDQFFASLVWPLHILTITLDLLAVAFAGLVLWLLTRASFRSTYRTAGGAPSAEAHTND